MSVRWVGYSALALGLIGFIWDDFTHVATHNHSFFICVYDAVLQTLQLYVINVPPTAMPNWTVRIAGLLAPLATASAALYAFWYALSNYLVGLQLRWRPASDLFLGGGEIAAALAREQKPKAQRTRIAAVDTLDETPIRAVCDGLFLRGDIDSVATLRAVQATRAERVWFMTGDDEVNLAGAQKLIKLWQEDGRGNRPQLFISLSDERLARVAPAPLSGVSKDWYVEFFDLFKTAARVLWKHYPPRLPPLAATHFALTRPPHIAIVGDGDFGVGLAIYAIRHWVLDESSQNCLRVTLFGSDADANKTKLLKQLPLLDNTLKQPDLLNDLLPLAQVQAYAVDASEIDPYRWRVAQTTAPFDAIYVVCRDDMKTLLAANRAHALANVFAPHNSAVAGERVKIVACLQRPSVPGDDAKKIAEGEKDRPFIRFNVFDDGIEPFDKYPGEQIDLLARRVNYVFASDKKYDVKNLKVLDAAAAQTWVESTPNEFRWSSRFAADHMQVKKMLLSRYYNLDAAHISDAAVQALMRLEHRRFVVERLLDGWLPVSAQSELGKAGKAVLRAQKLNTTLVPSIDSISAIAKKTK